MTPEGLNLRLTASTELDPLGVLLRGDRLSLLERVGDWYRVESELGRGFVHGDFIELDGGADSVPAREEDPEIGRVEDTEPPRLYSVRPGDTLSRIGERTGVAWQTIAKANGIVAPYTIHVNQLLRVPGLPAVAGRLLAIGNPLDDTAVVTASSAEGHHTPYGGSHAADLDVSGSSRGSQVRFVVTAGGLEARGTVEAVRPACANRKLGDGGERVEIAIEIREGSEGAWLPTGARLVYAHLEPTAVSQRAVVTSGDVLGQLGPEHPLATAASIGHQHAAGDPRGEEYHSKCAIHSHLHVEATGATWVARRTDSLRSGPLLQLAV